MKLTIARKLILLVVFVVIAMATIASGAFWFGQNKITLSTGDNAISIAKHSASEIRRHVQFLLSHTSILVQNILFSSNPTTHLSSEQKKEIKHLLSVESHNFNGLSEKLKNHFIDFWIKQRAVSFFNAAFLLDAEGNMRGEISESSIAHETARTLFKQYAGRSKYVGQFYYDSQSNIVALPVAFSIEYEDEIIGYLFASISLNTIFRDSINLISSYKTLEARVVGTSTGRLIYATKAHTPLSDISTSSLFKKINGNSGFFKHHEGGKEKLTAYIKTQGFTSQGPFNMAILLSYDTEEILKPITELKYGVFLGSFFISVLLLTATLFLIQSITAPIKRLKDYMIRVGEGELDRTITAKNQDEIGELSKLINGTVKRLSRTLISKDLLEKEVTLRQKYEIDLIQKNSELEKINSELERSNEELSRFTYVASHDLQEPLRMIASYTQLIKERYHEKIDEKGQEFLSYAHDGALRMKDLIQDLLVYSRIEKIDDNFQIIETKTQLEKAIKNLEFSIEEADAKIVYGHLPRVLGSDTEFLQLFQNLISNAIKFRRETPPIVEISAQKERNQWLFCVKDNGVGIDEAFKKKVFLLFQRLNTRKENRGTGVGLAICQRVVEKHGGVIWLESEVGKGSSFFFTIPIIQQQDIS